VYQTFLSFRYLRARPISWIGVAGIFVAVAALILILSIMSGFLAETRSHLRGSLSDLLIQPHLDRNLMHEGRSILPKRDVPGILEVILADPLVEGASAHYTWYGMLAAAGRERMQSDVTFGDLALVKLVGIDPTEEGTVSSLREDLVRDSLISDEQVADPDDPFGPIPGYEPDGRPLDKVLIGEQLARFWGLRRGRTLELVTAVLDPETGSPREAVSRSFVVAGTFRSKNNEFDLSTLYLPRSVMADWFGSGRGFTDVAVRLKDYEGTKIEAQKSLANKLHKAGYLHDPEITGGSEIRTWEDFQRSMLAAIENEKGLLGIMLSLVLLVAAFSVFAILSMLVQEKRRDIGVLCALGATQWGVMGTFLMIGLWEALLGTLLGLAAGIWSSLNINAIEQALSNTFGFQIFNREAYAFDHIPTVIEGSGVAAIVIGAFAASLIAAALPAWRAARLNPVEGLRHE
jgi:lipoprotein-releasing system permease protein